MRRHANFLVILGATLAVLASPQPAAAWRQWPFAPGAWVGPHWSPVPMVVFPTTLPYGSRFYYPPGVPLTYYEPGTGTTYCLSHSTGFYYVCGYSRPAPDAGEPAYRMPPAAGPRPGDQGLPPPPGVLLFRLPQDAEAEVDGAPVGLSAGLGIISVTPGSHRVVLRVSGTETEHMITVSPHNILTVTPSAIVPTAP